MQRKFLRITLFLMAGMFLLVSCDMGPKTFDDPVAAMMDREQDYSLRIRAAEQARQADPSDPRRLAALHKLVWSRGHPHEMRAYAIDQLIELDEQKFREELKRRIVRIQNWKTLEYIFAKAIERGWGREFTPTLVRQYARFVHGMKEKDRPERKVIKLLYPDKSVEQVVFDVFVQAGKKGESLRQAEAWDLLARICNKTQLIDFLKRAPVDTALVGDLKAAATDLGIIPSNKEGMLWLTYLRDPVRHAYWTAARKRVAQLTPEQSQGLELRHLPILLALNASQLTRSRQSWLNEITAYLKTTRHYLTGPEFDGPMADYPQRFSQAADQLGWMDLAGISLIIHAIKEPAIVRSLFAQADEDHRDVSTEYGGVLRYGDVGAKVRLYKPRVRTHDLKFYPTPQMYKALYTAIAHYHFHAQNLRNSDYAGPGVGDMKFSRRNSFSCLVFTFLDKNRMNVDYYQKGKTIVDLGVIHR